MYKLKQEILHDGVNSDEMLNVLFKDKLNEIKSTILIDGITNDTFTSIIALVDKILDTTKQNKNMRDIHLNYMHDLLFNHYNEIAYVFLKAVVDDNQGVLNIFDSIADVPNFSNHLLIILTRGLYLFNINDSNIKNVKTILGEENFNITDIMMGDNFLTLVFKLQKLKKEVLNNFITNHKKYLKELLGTTDNVLTVFNKNMLLLSCIIDTNKENVETIVKHTGPNILLTPINYIDEARIIIYLGDEIMGSDTTFIKFKKKYNKYVTDYCKTLLKNSVFKDVDINVEDLIKLTPLEFAEQIYSSKSIMDEDGMSKFTKDIL